MSPISVPLDGVRADRIGIVRTRTKKELVELLRSRTLIQELDTVHRPFANDIAEAHTHLGGRCWILMRRWPLDHTGNRVVNARHVFTSDKYQPWWSLPIHPGERAYEFDTETGQPAPRSARPYPHPVLPRHLAEIEGQRCGPYRDAFGLCSGCGLRGRIPRRCTADDPERSYQSIHLPHWRPWKWVPCPHGCGYIDQPETDLTRLYGLYPAITPTTRNS